MIEILRSVRQVSPPLFWTTAAHLAFLPVLFALLATDTRVILGISPWIKPIKFFVSSSIFIATTAFLMVELGAPHGSTAIGWIVAIAMIVENTLIAMQSVRGTTSHFNTGLVFDIAVFAAMGLFILANTVAIAWLLVLSFQTSSPAGLGYLWGIRLGIAIFLLGSLQAGFMLRIQSHTVGALDGGPGLPFVNWSTKFGDLRIGHFLGLHALQALPLAGWLIDRMGSPNPSLVVWIFALVYALITGLATLQALAGKPLVF